MIGGTTAGGRYQLNGFYGTAQEHAARQKAQREQAPYSAGAPSAGAASTAYRNVTNKNLDINVGPDGRTSLSNQSEQARRTAEAEAARKAKERQELITMLRSTNAAKPAATITHPGLNAGMEADARAAAFSRAKDQAGALARASLTAIAEQMAGRGVSGAGFDVLKQAGVLDDTVGGLTNVIRDQTISDAARAGQIADMNYQGGITQRGQDLSNRQSYQQLLRSLY